MIKKLLLILIIIFPTNSFSLIKVDITRGNLNPLPLAVSALSMDNISKQEFKKILKKDDIGLEISKVVENNLKQFQTNSNTVETILKNQFDNLSN